MTLGRGCKCVNGELSEGVPGTELGVQRILLCAKHHAKHLSKAELGGGFKYFYFHPYLGKIPILTDIFQRG